MPNPVEDYARAHRAQSHQNKVKIMFVTDVDYNWIVAFKEGRLGQPPLNSRQRRGAGAGPRRRVPVAVPVVQEPEFKFTKKVGWSGPAGWGLAGLGRVAQWWRRRACGRTGGAARRLLHASLTVTSQPCTPLQVLKTFKVMKDVNGQSILMRKVTRRSKAVWLPVVTIERLFDTFALHHAHSVGYRGEKKLWNFVSGTGSAAAGASIPVGLLPQHLRALASACALQLVRIVPLPLPPSPTPLSPPAYLHGPH